MLNPMFRTPNKLHGECFSSLILPLISPANVCVSQSEPGQILKIRKIQKNLNLLNLQRLCVIKTCLCLSFDLDGLLLVFGEGEDSSF